MVGSQAKNVSNKKSDRRKGFSIVKDVYIRPNGTINKVALGISILALVLVLGTIGYIKFGTVKVSTFESDVVSSLSSGDAQDAVATAFIQGIEKYNSGDTDYESQRQAILQLLVEMLNSDSGFTDNQKSALESTIREYLNGVDIYDTAEENEETINKISEMLNSTSSTNEKSLTQLKNTLQALIEANSSTDEKYEELNSLINEINNYLDTKSLSYEELLNQINETIANNKSTINNLFENSSGASSWNANTAYSKGDFVLYNNALYMSLKDNNTASLTDTSAWIRTTYEKLINETNLNVEELKETLLNMVLNSNSDLTTTKEEINTTITNLDQKYANYYVATGSVSTHGTTTITNSNIHTYSNINVVYDTTAGYTVDYTLTEGSLIITGKPNAESSVGGTVNATIYIDNSAVNAQ